MKMLKVIAAVVLLSATGAMFGTPKAHTYDKYKSFDKFDNRIAYIKKTPSLHKDQKIKLFEKLKNLQKQIHNAESEMGFSPDFNFEHWNTEWKNTERELEGLAKQEHKSNY